MVNENIITALQNSITKGEPLEQAKQVMVNSGYDQNEVEEASHYVGGNITQNNQPRPSEQLTMPNQKQFIKNQPFQANFQNPQAQQQTQQQNQLQPTTKNQTTPQLNPTQQTPTQTQPIANQPIQQSQLNQQPIQQFTQQPLQQTHKTTISKTA